jgi:hypothetical protein
MKTTKKLTTEIFIDRAQEIHKDLYSYTKSKYVNSRTNIIITCNKHGDFTIRPDHHIGIRKSGCPKCGSNILTQNEFIEKSNKIHNNIYDYSKTNYTLAKIKVTIICDKHGEFIQTPQKHLAGQGCPYCNRSEICGAKRMTTEQFIEKSNKIHNNRYNYSKTKYVLAKDKVIVNCKKHGDFEITPDSHLNGCGCNKCGFNTSLAADKWLESFNNPNIKPERTLKVNNRRFKVDGIDYTTNTIYEYFGSFWHGNINDKRIKGIHPILKKPYSQLYEETLDKINYLEQNGYKVIYIWGR